MVNVNFKMSFNSDFTSLYPVLLHVIVGLLCQRFSRLFWTLMKHIQMGKKIYLLLNIGFFDEIPKKVSYVEKLKQQNIFRRKLSNKKVGSRGAATLVGNYRLCAYLSIEVGSGLYSVQYTRYKKRY